MKPILIAIVGLTIASLSAFAGSCGSGCGDKEKDKDKEKEKPKETAAAILSIE